VRRGAKENSGEDDSYERKEKVKGELEGNWERKGKDGRRTKSIHSCRSLGNVFRLLQQDAKESDDIEQGVGVLFAHTLPSDRRKKEETQRNTHRFRQLLHNPIGLFPPLRRNSSPI
jgi:hypothetical protein